MIFCHITCKFVRKTGKLEFIKSDFTSEFQTRLNQKLAAFKSTKL